MKLWLSKNGEISVRDQLVAQVVAGVASGELQPGERLPSTREIARRFGVHSNTVSAAYRQLAADGTVELRRGSGIYVSDGGRDELDAIIDRLVADAADKGFSRNDVVERLTRANDHSGRPLAIFEPDADLCEIIIKEIRAATGLSARRLTETDLADGRMNDHQLVAMFDERSKIGEMIPGKDCIFLKANSVAAALLGHKRPSSDQLIAVVSGWADFLTFARLFLMAAKVDGDAILAFSTKESGWKRASGNASMIICDTVTAESLDGDKRLSIFPVVAEVSMDEIRRAAFSS